MVEREVVVGHEQGSHVWPAKDLVRKARQLESEVRIEKAGKSVNVRSLIKLPTLGAKKGDTVKNIAEGPDEEAAEAVVVVVSDEAGEGDA